MYFLTVRKPGIWCGQGQVVSKASKTRSFLAASGSQGAPRQVVLSLQSLPVFTGLSFHCVFIYFFK